MDSSIKKMCGGEVACQTTRCTSGVSIPSLQKLQPSGAKWIIRQGKKNTTLLLLGLVSRFNDALFNCLQKGLGPLAQIFWNFHLREKSVPLLSEMYLFWLWSPLMSKPRNLDWENSSIREEKKSKEETHLYPNHLRARIQVHSVNHSHTCKLEELSSIPTNT